MASKVVVIPNMIEDFDTKIKAWNRRPDGPVSIHDGSNQINAIGLDLDMKTNTFVLKQQVRATHAVN